MKPTNVAVGKGHVSSECRGGRQRAVCTGLSANRRQADAAVHFGLVLVNPEGIIVALQTSAGTYVTAANGDGMKGARGRRFVRTNRTKIGECELLHLEPVN